MKKLTFILLVLFTCPAFSQSGVQVEYKGGVRALDKLVGRATTDEEMDDDD